MFSSKRFLAVLLLALLPSVASAAQTTSDPHKLLDDGRVDDAIVALQSQISSTPNDAQAYNLLCRAHYALRDWDAAINACEKAVSLQPKESVYHLWLGRVYGEKADSSNFLTAAGLAKKVRHEFETAVQLQSDNVAARTDLAEFYLEAPGIMGGGKDKAKAQAEVLMKLDPMKAHWVNGRLAEKKKDYATAQREYQEEVEVTHGSADAWFDVALFYRHLERYDEMEDAIRHVSDAETDSPEILMESADILIRSGRNFPGAAKLLKRYLDSNQTVELAPAFRAHYLLGTVFEKQGDKAAAAQQYRVALSMAKNYSPAQEALNRVGR